MTYQLASCPRVPSRTNLTAASAKYLRGSKTAAFTTPNVVKQQVPGGRRLRQEHNQSGLSSSTASEGQACEISVCKTQKTFTPCHRLRRSAWSRRAFLRWWWWWCCCCCC